MKQYIKQYIKTINYKKLLFVSVILFFAYFLFATEVYASSNAGAVTTAIESTWKETAKVIKDVTNKVIFPAVDIILVILLFVKISTSYFEYKKQGTFDFLPIAVLLFGLIFSLVAPSFLWSIIGV